MFRLACVIAIIVFIFVHSPVRTTGGTQNDATRWMAQAKDEIAKAAMKPEVLQSLAAHAMSRKLSAQADAARGAPH